MGVEAVVHAHEGDWTRKLMHVRMAVKSQTLTNAALHTHLQYMHTLPVGLFYHIIMTGGGSGGGGALLCQSSENE